LLRGLGFVQHKAAVGYSRDCSLIYYTPRNSILFFDKNDKLFLNIEMCFDCDKIYFTPAQIPSKAFMFVAEICHFSKHFSNNATSIMA
jgi:hypothetical protein